MFPHHPYQHESTTMTTSYEDLYDEIDARREPTTTTERHLPAFVYGTLRRNQGNWSWCLQGRTIAEVPATLNTARMWSNGGFPFVSMTDATDAHVVVGELMYIPENLFADVLNDLDSLEGFYGEGNPRNMYDRKIVTVTTADGEQVEAYTYLVSPDLYVRRVLGDDLVEGLPLVESGDWLAHRAATPTRW